MNYIYKILFVLSLLLAFSCERSLEEVNIDPNKSLVANDAELLTSAQGFLGYIQDVDLNSQSFLWAQYYAWGLGVSSGNDVRYVAEPIEFNAHWERSYADALIDLKTLSQSEDNGYSGAGKLLSAYIYQTLVDHYGDIPFSEALRGETSDGAIFAPNYDDASAIYPQLADMVDAGMMDLDGGTTSMGSDDLIFGGDVSSWMRFGNSLKLKILMRTSETAGNGSAIMDLVSNANGGFIESSVDRASIPFAGDAGNENPMYARFEWGVGDFYFASNATVNLLNTMNDPRVNAFYSVASTGPAEGTIRAIDQGTVEELNFTDPPTDYSGSSPIAYGAANDVMLITEWEVDFLRAEAAARYSTGEDDEALFRSAVQKNFDFLNVTDSDGFVAGLDYSGDLDNKIDAIAVQKWVSMNGTQEDEGWVETRRFDRPGNRLFTEGIFQSPPLSVLGEGNYPSLWLYPQTERSLNPNSPAQRQITEKVFWDN